MHSSAGDAIAALSASTLKLLKLIESYRIQLGAAPTSPAGVR